MNRKELKIKLEQLGIRERIYSLYGKENPNTTVLAYRNRKWIVYGINERGNQHIDGIFETENDACEFLYQNMIEFKWIMDNAHIHPDDKPKSEDIIGFEVSNNGKVNAILKYDV